MNNRMIVMQNWLNKRSKRDKLYLFIMGFLLIYLIYFILFFRPVSTQKKELLQKMSVMGEQQVALKQQVENIKNTINTPVYFQMSVEQKKLISQLEKAAATEEKLKEDLFSPDEMQKLTKDILKQKPNNAVLISLEELPVEPWPPQEGPDKKNVLTGVTEGYQHGLQIEFQTNYFGTIDYLTILEKMSRHMYWDHMDLKVVQYPKSNIVIKFHVLSLEKN